MRHVYTNRVVVILASLLLAAAGLLAWSRSRPATDAAKAPPTHHAAEPAVPDDSEQLASGERLWKSRCAGCHRAADSESVVPARIVASARRLASTDEGRSELVRLLIAGTPASSAERRRPHPTYADLSDHELQALLNLVLYQEPPAGATASDRPAAYALGEVARLRAANVESPAGGESR